MQIRHLPAAVAVSVFTVFLAPAQAEEKPAPKAPATPVPSAAAPATPAPAPADKVFAPNDLPGLKAMYGKPVTVEGTIAVQGENKNGNVRYLNFTKNYKESLSLVMMVKDGSDQFAPEKLGKFVGKKVRVKGNLDTYNGAVQIKLSNLEQIEVLP